jgi:hypothetical protein
VAFEQVRPEDCDHLDRRLGVRIRLGQPGLDERFRAEYFPDRVIYRCRLIAGCSTERDEDLFLPAFALPESKDDTLERAAEIEALAQQYWRGMMPMQ